VTGSLVIYVFNITNRLELLDFCNSQITMLAISFLVSACFVVICKGVDVADTQNDLIVANSSCIRIEMVAGFNLSYSDQHSNQQWKYFEIPQEELDITGECKDRENRIELAFDTEDVTNAHVLIIFSSAGSHYKLTELKVSATIFGAYSVSETAENLALFPVVLGSSHNCISRQDLRFAGSSSTGFVERAMVQAFMQNPGKFSTGVECPIDAKMDDLVPIAVGGALAASAVIVIIGFLVANKGYAYKRIYRPSF